MDVTKLKTPTTKAENYELYHKGYYGNHLAFWPSLGAFLQDETWDQSRPVALRTSFTPGIQLPYYCVPTMPIAVGTIANEWESLGVPLSAIVLNEIGPDEFIAIQGEVMLSINGMDLRYSTEKLLMRQALAKSQKHVSGLVAQQTLLAFLDPTSYDNLQRLFDDFPDAIIEFSTYSRPVGVLQNNTVIWEVRNY